MNRHALWLLVLLTGCPDRTISEVPIAQGKVQVERYPAVERRNLDILFVIDNSGSMEQEQNSLKANFGKFISVLQSLEGGLPNIHLGVVTSDMGTSALDGNAPGIGGCTGTGEGGTLRSLPGGGPNFLSDIDDGAGGRARNYSGNLTDAFAQLATVGINGCGIEQHLEAMKRALDGNPANNGFLRDDPNTILAVVVIADEDDCSLAENALFDGNQSDQRFGDRVNFKCAKQGVQCDTPATDLETPGPRQDCYPRETDSQLTGLRRYVEFLNGLKTDPKSIVVAGIVGNVEPFATLSDRGVTVLDDSCEYNSPTGERQFAYPAIRIAGFLDQFPDRNLTTTICSGDLSQPLVDIGRLINNAKGNPCLDLQLADVSPADGNQYDCTVLEVRSLPDGSDQELGVIAQCDANRSKVPCWHIEESPERCEFTAAPHLELMIERDAVPAPDVYIKASCVTSNPTGSLE
ncbi:MAG: hypothetical protein AB7O24_03165 [Kofleriaceae bacterium]